MSLKRSKILLLSGIALLAFIVGSFSFKSEPENIDVKNAAELEKYTESIAGTDVEFTMF